MATRVKVTGQAELRKLAARIRQAERVEVEAEVRKGQREAFAGLEPAVKSSALATLPSGYRKTMAAAVSVSIRTSFGRGATVKAVVFSSDGKNRDIRTINKGRLKHPLFGDRTRWHTTTVRPGFVDRAVAALPQRAYDESAEAIDTVLKRLSRG